MYVLIPLLAAFRGPLGTSKGRNIEAILHWTYKTINRHKYSLLNVLKSSGIDDPSKYITFCSLRTHGSINETPVTELIYVHSKLLIVDDKITIVGSANLNDRSLLGCRDSEMCVIIEDTKFVNDLESGSKHQ